MKWIALIIILMACSETELQDCDGLYDELTTAQTKLEEFQQLKDWYSEEDWERINKEFQDDLINLQRRYQQCQ